MPAFSFSPVCSQKEVSWSQVFLVEAVESEDKNRDVTDHIFRAPCMFCKKSLGKFNAKDVEISRNWSVHEFYRLKALVTLKQMNTSVSQKTRIFMCKTSMVRLTGRV